MSQATDKAGRPDKKKRLSVYLDPDVSLRLKDHAGRREQSCSMIAEAAIASFLSPDADDRREGALAKRLDRIDRTMQRLDVSFQEVVHSVRTEEAEVAEASDSSGRTEWTSTRMRL